MFNGRRTYSSNRALKKKKKTLARTLWIINRIFVLNLNVSEILCDSLSCDFRDKNRTCPSLSRRVKRVRCSHNENNKKKYVYIYIDFRLITILLKQKKKPDVSRAHVVGITVKRVDDDNNNNNNNAHMYNIYIDIHTYINMCVL